MKGVQARVFFGGNEEPSLVVNDLKRGVSRGGIAPAGKAGGTAYFSNFRYDTDAEISFDAPPPVETPLGMVADWEISRSFRLGEIDTERHPTKTGIVDLQWRKASSDPSGLVNVAKHHGRSGSEPDAVYARTTIRSDHRERRRLSFGSSDLVTIFLNGEPVFMGNSAYRQRDPSFLGIIGLHDEVYLPLEPGENELLLLVVESFGGWGFVVRDPNTVFRAERVTDAWETAGDFRMAEAVVHDPARDVLYVSNYDGYNRQGPAAGAQFLSRMSVDGTVRELRWVQGLKNPTGMVLIGELLYVVEKHAVAEIDVRDGSILRRITLPEPVFPNDVAADDRGILYVTDSSKGAIYRLSGDVFEEWIRGGELQDPNALFVRGGELLVGNNGDNCLKAIDLETGAIRPVIHLAVRQCAPTPPADSGTMQRKVPHKGNRAIAWMRRPKHRTPDSGRTP